MCGAMATIQRFSYPLYKGWRRTRRFQWSDRAFPFSASIASLQTERAPGIGDREYFDVLACGRFGRVLSPAMTMFRVPTPSCTEPFLLDAGISAGTQGVEPSDSGEHTRR